MHFESSRKQQPKREKKDLFDSTQVKNKHPKRNRTPENQTMESFVQCHYCQKSPNSPIELVCRHTYCTECVTKEIKNDKFVCPVCNTEHSAPAASLSSAKQDKLLPYLIGLNSGAPYAVITDDSPQTIQAECSGCKKTTDLRTCYHCEKPLCAECRSKHFETQKKEVDDSINSLSKKTSDLVILAQQLNSSRASRIQEYKTMKEQLSVHVKDLIKKIHDEEQDLQKKIDGRIQLENEKVNVTNREEQYLEKNKQALASVVDKYRGENSQMVLLKMHKDYLGAAPLWKEKLDTHAGRLNPKKEEELHFHPAATGKSGPIVGSITDSGVSINAPSGAKKMAARNDQTESRACSIM